MTRSATVSRIGLVAGPALCLFLLFFWNAGPMGVVAGLAPCCQSEHPRLREHLQASGKGFMGCHAGKLSIIESSSPQFFLFEVKTQRLNQV